MAGREGRPTKSALCFIVESVRTNFYIDGFNLYYGALRGTRLKWLDLAAFCRQALPNAHVHRIRYFTARVEASSNDPGKPTRQDTYLRALGTIPNLSVHFGHFLTNALEMPLAAPPDRGSVKVRVLKTEEKGSDVNLASFLLLDAFDGDFEQAVIISNDSDLLFPVMIVRDRFGLPVGVLNPQKNTSWALRNAATFYRPVRRWLLEASQFADTLATPGGFIKKPDKWAINPLRSP